jgi:hypothetical protein
LVVETLPVKVAEVIDVGVKSSECAPRIALQLAGVIVAILRKGVCSSLSEDILSSSERAKYIEEYLDFGRVGEEGTVLSSDEIRDQIFEARTRAGQGEKRV